MACLLNYLSPLLSRNALCHADLSRHYQLFEVEKSKAFVWKLSLSIEKFCQLMKSEFC